MIPPLLKPVIAGLIALVSCLVITPLVIKFAYRKGWVVKPRSDRWHQRPTALMGGVAIFSAYSIALFSLSPAHINWMLYGASSIMFLTGLIDDIWEVKPVVKVVVQIVCSFILIYYGFNFGGGLLSWGGIPLTFIWVMGITNAINLLDNMDGLAAGISAIVALITGILTYLNGETDLAIPGFAIAGAAIGFLVYNFKPARIFMGDSGSLFLGFSLAYLSIAVQYKMGSSSAVWVLFIPISLMAIPIMDTTLVTIKRILAGRRIDQGGRDHTSHRLVALGLSEKQAVLTLYGISILWGVLCLLMYKTQVNNLLLCILLVTVSSVIFSVLLSKVKVYNETEETLTYQRLRGKDAAPNSILRFFLFQKKLIAGVVTDILIIYASFLIAKSTLHINVKDDSVILGTFICVKISVLYITRLYYRIWRYMEIVEVAAYFSFILLACILLAVILYFKGKFGIYTPYFFMVDFLLSFTGIVFSRLFYRWINELISRNREAKKRVIIYGAGDSGYLLIKELLQNHKHELRPVGWIDDDETKHNMYLYGYKIYGGKSSLQNICERLKPDLILISTNAISIEDETEIREILEAQNISLGRFNMLLSFS
ncbi:MAG TPA: hypothetical protein VJ844_12785 [Mucilaginibacter sp.]|nr:hypothetical protein [Mucilaginibacter sp.]